MTNRDITVSIVSHLQMDLARNLIADLRRHCGPGLAIVLTANLPEDLAGVPQGVDVIRNNAPKGFGANHNAAFARCRTRYFCVANPDVSLESNPFPRLVAALGQPEVAVAAPLVRSPDGQVEDSARRFPTAVSLLRKIIGRGRLDYGIGDAPLHPDWVAGMFMLFRSETFRTVNGFDERYRLYYEDVDICARIRRTGGDVVLDPAVEVVHAARRASRRNLRHAWWHAQSMARYLFSGVGRVPPDDRLAR